MNQPLAFIIEDDQKLATIFTEALHAAQYSTESILSGEKAVARLTETTPDLVVLDLHLPEVSGKDILHKIRADSRLQSTRVILATADPIVAETLREEADVVLIKPVSYSQLRDLAMRLRPPTYSKIA
jgi:two-component system response regulator BaeR